ncbi:hypothetical protein FIU94_07040 [Sulfitobacter sp. THAF37]|uniref:DUF3833 family protein n=1 Tax=Sulfitobacter sp. THAF37 TaxID=2587855 RepID=UPI001267BC72|nr:DUF3833 family protein [Sulfitobacter sp. THAF37]QFT58582.1 hypothetical protein FIU94_07040 [Sulfitobacter sp. THAF37]
MENFIFLALGIALAMFGVLVRRRFAEFPGQSPDDYSEGFPAFDLKKHLTGKMVCEGVIFGPLGRMTSSFVADFDISWSGDTGLMAERFRYNDGSIQHREWHITLGEDGAFAVRADDVPGVGSGHLSGSTAQLRYEIVLPPESGGHRLRAEDWMYLTPDGTIVNRSQFRKYGFKVAELVATIRPKE